MATSAFYFYRGTAHLYYDDILAGWPTAFSNYATNYTLLMGDLHLANFGAANDNSGTVVFDINDFGENPPHRLREPSRADFQLSHATEPVCSLLLQAQQHPACCRGP